MAQLDCKGNAAEVDALSVVGVLREGDVAVVAVVGVVGVSCVVGVVRVVGVAVVVLVVGLVLVEGVVMVLLVGSFSSNPRKDLHSLQLFNGTTQDDAAGHASRTGQDLSAEASKFRPVLTKSGKDVGKPVSLVKMLRDRLESP